MLPHNRLVLALQENVALNYLLLVIDFLGSNVTITVLVSVCLHMPEHVDMCVHRFSLKRILKVRFYLSEKAQCQDLVELRALRIHL